MPSLCRKGKCTCLHELTEITKAVEGRNIQFVKHKQGSISGENTGPEMQAMGILGISCKFVSSALGLLLIICFVRTFVLINLRKEQLPKCSVKEKDFIELTHERWERFRNTLRIKSISNELTELEKMLKYVIKAHPSIFKSSHVSYEIVNNYSLLIHVQGKNKNLFPYLLAAHFDVVPVVEEEWSVDPFNATENEDKTYVYGRGALDCKSSLMAHLATLEFMLQRDIIPERSFYLAYGHDEEIMGPDGAPEIAKTLQAKGVNKLHFVLDEGMMVLENPLPGSSKNIAFIGVTERASMNLNLSIEIHGGHSSIPAAETSLSVLAGAVARLQSNPMAGRIDSLVEAMLESLAPEVGFPLNVLMSNVWLFKPLLWRIIARDQRMQGTVRTTTAVTIFKAGKKSNVIPTSAWAIVNQRMHHMDSVEDVLQHDRNTINDDRIKINVIKQTNPHPISPSDPETDLPYQVITDTIDQIYDDHLVTAATLVANTDTRCYLSFTRNVYRFNPFSLTNKDISGIHAMDERISRDNFERMMNFYFHLILNSDRIQLRNWTNNKEEL